MSIDLGDGADEALVYRVVQKATTFPPKIVVEKGAGEFLVSLLNEETLKTKRFLMGGNHRNHHNREGEKGGRGFHSFGYFCG